MEGGGWILGVTLSFVGCSVSNLGVNLQKVHFLSQFVVSD